MNLCSKYFQTSIETQSKPGLVVKLYDGAIRFLNMAILDIQSNNFASKSKNIAKAVGIINELNISLDIDAGQDIAKNLRSLYNFCIRQLRAANIKNDKQMIKQVIFCLNELHTGFKSVAV